MIGKFIASLSDNGKRLLIIATVVFSIALFDRLLIGPTMSQMNTIDQSIEREESSIKQSLRFLEHKERILKESSAFEPYLTTKLSTEEEIIASFLKKIESIAGKAGITIAKTNPASGTKEKDYLRYQADLECSGKLENLINFMHLINTSQDLMKVIKFSFASKGDDLKATMSIVKVIVVKGTSISSPQAKE